MPLTLNRLDLGTAPYIAEEDKGDEGRAGGVKLNANMDAEEAIVDELEASIAGKATIAQGELAASAVQPGDDLSRLTNDSGFEANEPLASQGEAEAGVDNTKTMTALRVAQAIAVLAAGLQNKYDGTTAPGASDDADAGYSAGSYWIHATATPPECYRCADPSPGAAVWIKTTLTSDELAAVALSGDSDDLTEGSTNLLMTAGERAAIAANTAKLTANTANVEAAGSVMETDFDANTILAATSDDTPAALTVDEQTLIGRITGGGITALTPSQIRTMLNVAEGATGDQSGVQIRDAYQSEVPLISQGVAEAGTDTSIFSWSALLVAQAIAAQTGPGLDWSATQNSPVADGADAVAFSHDTENVLTALGAKLASWSNGGTEKVFIDKDGVLNASGEVSGNLHRGLTFGSDTDKVHLEFEDNRKSISFSDNSVAGKNNTILIGHSAEPGTYGSVNIGYRAKGHNQSGTVTIGYLAEATDRYGVAIGYKSVSVHRQGFALAGIEFAAAGDNQYLIWQPAATTTDATPNELFLDEDDVTKRMDIAEGHLYAFEAHIVGVQSDGTDAAYYTRKGIIANNSGTTALIGAIQTVGTDIESNASTDVSITADDTNDSLKISVTGIAAETWRWSSNITVKQIGIGT